MKVVILAGGIGSRITEESVYKPKPMIEIGGMPILWHIMKIYSFYGFKEFIICCGYKGEQIKEYFFDFSKKHSDFTIELSNDNIEFHKKNFESWKITLVDTGINTQTAGRIKRVSNYLKDTFCLTYGDGVTDQDISKLVKFHKQNKCLVTITGIKARSRFGSMEISDDKVIDFNEKPQIEKQFFNGGFFVCEPKAIDYIANDSDIWEVQILKKLSKIKQLAVYKHDGFWSCLDTLRDKINLENIWSKGDADWKVW